MNYPLVSEYIEAIKAAEDNLDELSYLRPVLDNDGLPVMTNGNFAVVFKMKDEQSGKLYAVKCFTKEQEGRKEAYCEIASELNKVSSPYLVSIRYLEKELFVDTDQTTETEFPVLLMDWVEGKTLDKKVRENLNDKSGLKKLAYGFSQLAQWLILQPFAHGDLKPDNIIVREDCTLVLVDYDGMFVPAMKDQKAREMGSPDFRHPQRTENDFDEHIDDFPIISILLSLRVISLNPSLLKDYGAQDRLLFSKNDYLNINSSNIVKQIIQLEDSVVNTYVSILFLLINRESFLSIVNNHISISWQAPIYGKAIISKIYKTRNYGKEKPFVRVVYKKFMSGEQEYECIYNLQLIYAKECTKNDVFDYDKAFQLFTKEFCVGMFEDINLYDIPINKISCYNVVRDIYFCNEFSSIPLAVYADIDEAIKIAKKKLNKMIKEGYWIFPEYEDN